MKMLNLISKVLENPHHRCGAIVARLGVNIATLIWSILVLTRKDAIAATSYGFITLLMHENYYGLFFLALSLWMIARIVWQARPRPIGILAYGLLLGGWLFIYVCLWLTEPLQLTSVSAVSVVTLFAFYGFIANPKRQPGDGKYDWL